MFIKLLSSGWSGHGLEAKLLLYISLATEADVFRRLSIAEVDFLAVGC